MSRTSIVIIVGTMLVAGSTSVDVELVINERVAAAVGFGNCLADLRGGPVCAVG